MVSTSTVIIAIGIITVILIGAAVGLLYFLPGTTNHTTTSTTTTTPITTTTSSTVSTASMSTTTSTFSTTTTRNTTTISSPSTITSSRVTNSTSTSTSYVLQLVQAGSGSILSSTLTTQVPLTPFQSDGLGGDCGGVPCYTYNYTDGGNLWQVQGDFEPGSASLSGNSTGFTMTDQTCSSSGNPLQVCGPYWEWNGDKRSNNGVLAGEENVSELSAALYGIAANAQVFSINLNLPNYSSIFSNCAFNISSTGCSYEGYAPQIVGVWALDVGSNSIAVSLAEGAHSMSVSISTATFINGQYQPNLSKNLNVNVPTFPRYMSNNRLVIATDRSSFIKIFVDNTLEYSNTTMPVDLSSNSLSVNFYQFDNVDNETLSTTWSNFTASGSPNIIVSGLVSGMSVLVNGTNGFNQTAIGNSSGVAVIDVSSNPVNLEVSVELNGKVIDTYGSSVNAGTQLKLVSTSSTTIVSSTIMTTYVTTYVTTETR
ncbi:MAG: hypothetical protein ACYC7D_04245 [Nitrososphaerales archaeon]